MPVSRAVYLGADFIKMAVALIQEVGISSKQLDNRVSDDHLRSVSLFLTSWKTLAPFLGLDEADVEAIEAGREEDERKLKMLRRWKNKSAFKATYRMLVDALLSLRMTSHAERVCRLLQPETTRSVFETQGGSLSSSVEALQTDLSTVKTQEIDALRKANETLQSEIKQKDSVISSLRTEIERMRSEVTSVINRSITETESSRAKVPRLSCQQRAANCEFTTGLSPHTRLQWRKGADAPEGISEAQVVVMGERVYVGGRGTTVYQYDWVRDTWKTLPPCPVERFGMTQFLGKLITVGGVHVQKRHEDKNKPLIMCRSIDLRRDKIITGKVYQFNKQQWVKILPHMPTPRCDLAVVTTSPKLPTIVTCGGIGFQKRPVNTVEVYSHSSSQWHTARPPPITCIQLPAFGYRIPYDKMSVTVDNTCYILRELTNAKWCCFSASLDSLIDSATSPSTVFGDPIWKSVSDPPLPQFAAANLRGSLVVIGGVDTSTNNTLLVFHVLTGDGSWERVRRADLPEPRKASTAVCLPSGELLVVGGRDNSEVKRTVFIASVVD